MQFEVQAHRGNDELTLRRLLAVGPSSVEIDVGVIAGEIVIAHETDLADASGLGLDAALLAAGNTTVVVEAKCFPPETPSPRAFVAALQPYLGRIALCSFEERVLAEALRVRPALETTFLFRAPQSLATSARTVGPRHDLVTRDLVASAHALGLGVVPWTVNDVPTMAALVDLGVDGLVTDEPALAQEVAASRLAIAA
ncbi:MAG: glycerophosphodiester phosphodiesterase [Actinobacteria bacterium]|nr:glycerophosphodiester phosphodiesterase [Actinomycetota bacterium]